MSAPESSDSRWAAEAVRLYRRYEREIVDAHDFCPWASRVRRDGRLEEHVLLQQSDKEVEPSLAVIDALPSGTDLALLLYPRLSLARDAFERFAARVRDASVIRHTASRGSFVFVAFHPDAESRIEEAERLIPFLRRTPDPTIQVLRSEVLDRVRAAASEGTQFVDPRAMGTWQPQPQSLRERIAEANLTTTLRIGLDTLAGQLDDIIHDRQETYRGLEGGTSHS
jgi:hypothetical protein